MDPKNLQAPTTHESQSRPVPKIPAERTCAFRARQKAIQQNQDNNKPRPVSKTNVDLCRAYRARKKENVAEDDDLNGN